MQAELDALFEKNTASLAASLDQAVQSALAEYEGLRKSDGEGGLSQIYISFLLSGVLCKTPWLRIDLCDENGWDDMVGCGAEWEIPFISDKMCRDVDEVAKQHDRIKDYELERLWLVDAEGFVSVLERVLPAVVEGCAAAEQCEGCAWHFGQYLGATVTVREKSA